jgi:hypothetical protein
VAVANPQPGAERVTAARGMTVAELARFLRVSPDKIRGWISCGELGALNTATARCGKPRYVILPHHLSAFERGHQAADPPKPSRRRLKPVKDYFADE